MGADDRFEDAATTRAREQVEAGDALGIGDEVTFTVGKETFCPVKFHAFDVGPVTVKTSVREGETGAEAFARAKAVTKAEWSREYAEKLAGHLERVRLAAGWARGSSVTESAERGGK